MVYWGHLGNDFFAEVECCIGCEDELRLVKVGVGGGGGGGGVGADQRVAPVRLSVPFALGEGNFWNIVRD